MLKQRFSPISRFLKEAKLPLDLKARAAMLGIKGMLLGSWADKGESFKSAEARQPTANTAFKFY